MSISSDSSRNSSSNSDGGGGGGGVITPIWRRLPDIEPTPNATSRRRSRLALTAGAAGRTFGEAGVILRTNPSYEHLLAVKLSRISTERSRALRTINANRQRFVDDQLRKRSRLINVNHQLGSRVKGQVARPDWTPVPEDETGDVDDELKVTTVDRSGKVKEVVLTSPQYSWQFGTDMRQANADSSTQKVPAN